MMQSIVVAGAGLAGVRAVDALRSSGFDGRIVLIGEEPELPYDRPPLSKGYLAGTDERSRLDLRSPESYSADRIDVRLGAGVASAAVGTGSVALSLSDGTAVDADALVIATGSRARRASFPIDHQAVHEIRTAADADRLRPSLVPGARIAIIGAGFIGAEAASTAVKLGCEVTVLEALEVPLSRQLGAEMGAACAALHERNGVTLRTGVTVSSIEPDGVHLEDGTVVPADAVVVGVGAAPNVEWLATSGIEIRDGVCTDESLRVRMTDGSVAHHIVAIGDVARWHNRLFDEEMRIEHWTNAAESAEHAASVLLGGVDDAAAFAPVPYFWSDQYGRKIQFFGRSTNHDEVRVVHGTSDDPAWLALYRRGDRLVGALGMHKMRAAVRLRGAIAERSSWEAALELADSLR